jgi:hypothetical protein
MGYTDSGHLLPLDADGAGSNFLHISGHSKRCLVAECIELLHGFRRNAK